MIWRKEDSGEDNSYLLVLVFQFLNHLKIKSIFMQVLNAHNLKNQIYKTYTKKYQSLGPLFPPRCIHKGNCFPFS